MTSTYFPRSSLSLSTARKLLSRAAANKRTGGPPPGTPGATNYNITDTRYEVIKRILFETPKPELPNFTEEDLERHETIERAWKLFLRNQREAKSEEMSAKYRMLNEANIQLEQISKSLFDAAQLGNKTMLFPGQLKIPTETPSLSGWNYDYIPPPEPDPLSQIKKIEEKVSEEAKIIE
ncbi:1644_t:CDS:1 [Funneliformis geosporum]|uniref:Large ribosomal subunit protein mL40 n=1 Tax=Funneliformis geosporum TaxID=1117311 RepID=A0A9W4WXC0_9GLOM|nr:1644_t:CDS:1 [Funneliformis geosporum]CAI2179212.1 3302_t:CDS:1 [Funneliformis geosporum]